MREEDGLIRSFGAIVQLTMGRPRLPNPFLPYIMEIRHSCNPGICTVQSESKVAGGRCGKHVSELVIIINLRLYSTSPKMVPSVMINDATYVVSRHG